MFNNYYLRYFVDSVELGSLTKSAKKNHVSIAAVSQAIKNLEASFEISIIDHHKNRFSLTAEGILLYEKSRKILKEITYFYEDIKSQSQEISGKVSFATNSALATILFPNVLINMKKKYPQIKVEFKAGYSTTVRHYTAQGDVDFGININYLNIPECHQTTLFKGNFVCIKKRGSSRDQSFLFTEKGSESKSFQKLYKAHNGSNPILEMSVESWEVIIKMAIKGIGIGIIPDFYLWDLDKKDYSIHKVPFEMPDYEVNTYVLKKRRINSQAEKLISEIQSEVKRLQSL